jgi:hypothetical protein
MKKSKFSETQIVDPQAGRRRGSGAGRCPFHLLRGAAAAAQVLYAVSRKRRIQSCGRIPRSLQAGATL